MLFVLSATHAFKVSEISSNNLSQTLNHVIFSPVMIQATVDLQMACDSH